MQAIAIFNALLGTAGVTALVGQRIYPVELPQGGALPAIAIDAEPDVPLPTIDAAAGYNLRQVQVVVHLVAKTAATLAALQTAVETACNFQRGTVAGYSVVTVAAGTVGRAETDSAVTLWYLPLNFTLTYRR